MTDKIYQRTKLGDSLLSTLEGLWREGRIDADEAQRIAADFDEVIKFNQAARTACVTLSWRLP